MNGGRRMTVRGFISKYNKDHGGGALMFVLGLGAMFQGMSYKVGSLSRMGPGFFPMALGILLALMGAAIFFTAHKNEDDAKIKEEPLPPEWRAWFLIVLSLVAFIVFGIYGGLLPATFAVVFISAMADRENTVKQAVLLSLALSVVCVVVFWWALDMQFPLFRWG